MDIKHIARVFSSVFCRIKRIISYVFVLYVLITCKLKRITKKKSWLFMELLVSFLSMIMASSDHSNMPTPNTWQNIWIISNLKFQFDFNFFLKYLFLWINKPYEIELNSNDPELMNEIIKVLWNSLLFFLKKTIDL